MGERNNGRPKVQQSVIEYSPLPPEATMRILARWRRYRETIGLEGKIYFDMKNEGRSAEDIKTAIKEHREARESLIEEFHRENEE